MAVCSQPWLSMTTSSIKVRRKRSRRDSGAIWAEEEERATGSSPRNRLLVHSHGTQRENERTSMYESQFFESIRKHKETSISVMGSLKSSERMFCRRVASRRTSSLLERKWTRWKMETRRPRVSCRRFAFSELLNWDGTLLNRIEMIFCSRKSTKSNRLSANSRLQEVTNPGTYKSLEWIPAYGNLKECSFRADRSRQVEGWKKIEKKTLKT